MEKTPAWIKWAIRQAAALEAEQMEKVSMVIGSIFGFAPADAPKSAKAPRTLKETVAELEKSGFKVKR